MSYEEIIKKADMFSLEEGIIYLCGDYTKEEINSIVEMFNRHYFWYCQKKRWQKLKSMFKLNESESRQYKKPTREKMEALAELIRKS